MGPINKNLKVVIGSLCCILLVVISGCATRGEVTGGGWISNYRADGTTSNFGFNASSCDATKVSHFEYAGITGHFNYVDQTAYHPDDYPEGGVKMNGKIIEAVECVHEGELHSKCDGCEGGYGLKLAYRSTNPREKGTGLAKICVYDNGEGANAAGADTVKIRVISGPFDGYYNAGDVQGNIQAHECEET
jgi:hypothetical protein